MIDQPTFLGISLATRRNRRLLVIGYYVILLFLSVLAVVKVNMLTGVFIVQTLTLGGFFGGIRAGGPVKSYASADNPGYLNDSHVLQLNLSGRKPSAMFAYPLLDERETVERDHAHFLAYTVLRWTLGGFAALFWLSLNWIPERMYASTPALLWVLLVYVLSLPQSVILWTEPEALGTDSSNPNLHPESPA